jgi:single-stranded-DNA-specific exonuclease
MAAGFTIKKNNINLLDDFIQKDYSNKNSSIENTNIYDREISSSAINSEFIKELNKLEPFGNFNDLPLFLIKNVKIIKTNIIKQKHI